MPELRKWPGKLDRAVREASEGTIWEADHRVEVRDGGGEASDVRAFDPLCVACHQAKTSARTAGGARDGASEAKAWSGSGSGKGCGGGNGSPAVNSSDCWRERELHLGRVFDSWKRRR